jgi:4-amino-4-deoxy-L-arabinose transferase-like glycosyltransferase
MTTANKSRSWGISDGSLPWGTLALLILGIAGFFALLYHTRFGAATNGDAVQYVAGARSILAGEGFGMPDGFGQVQPLIAMPPFFSAALAAVGLLGVDPLEGARYLHVFLYGVNIVLAGLLVYRNTGSSTPAILVGLWFLTSTILLSIHTFALTEPLFITLLLICFYMLSRFSESSTRAWLLAAGLAAGFATITRFAGLALVAAGALSLLALTTRAWRRRILDALLFGGLGVAPFLLWSWRNVQLGGTATARQVEFMITRTRLVLDLGNASTWILPDSIDRGLRILIFVGLILLFAAFILYLTRRVFLRGEATEPSRWFLVLLGVFILSYIAMMAGSMAYLDATMRINHRYLSPAIITAMMLIGILFYWVLVTEPKRQFVRSGVLAVAGIVLALNAWRFVQFLQDPGITYGLTDPRFSSETIAAIEQLDESIPIITDQREKVYILTGRNPHSVPHGIHGFTQQPREDLPEQMYEFRNLLAQGAVFAMFDEYLLSQSPPVAGTLVEGLVILRDMVDGTLYVNPAAWPNLQAEG